MSAWKIDDVGPAAERINLDEKMTAIDLAEVSMDLLEEPRSWIVRLKRLGWVRRKTRGAFPTCSGKADDFCIHVGPKNRQTSSLPQFGGALVHFQQIAQQIALQGLRNDDSSSHDDHSIFFVDFQMISNAPKWSKRH